MITVYYEWIVMMNNQKNDEGRKRYSGTTLRGYHSMLKKYFKVIWLTNIEKLVPEVLDRLREYESVQPCVKKAEIFSKDDINDMLNFADTPDFVVMKSFMIIGKAMAGRSIEIHGLKRDQVRKNSLIILFSKK